MHVPFAGIQDLVRFTFGPRSAVVGTIKLGSLCVVSVQGSTGTLLVTRGTLCMPRYILPLQNLGADQL